MRPPTRSIRGRGAADNPPNRFEHIDLVHEEEEGYETSSPRTEFLPDASRTVIARNTSPDIAYSASINPYRGCEHGCAYCYARPFHEFLGFSAGLDFETKIMVKERAPELLRRELASRRWVPQPLALSGVTDPYQPVERRLKLTRRCLEVLNEFRNPVALITKNRLVARDVDVLAELARWNGVTVTLSITTLDVGLNRILEPRSSLPRQRVEAVETLSAAGIPVGVLIAPVIPGLTDGEIPAIVGAAADAGARFAGQSALHFPHGVADLFEDWLERHMPGRKDKVLNRMRAMHGGRLRDNRPGQRFVVDGPFAQQVADLFAIACRRARLGTEAPALETGAFRCPPNESGADGQLPLFE